MTIGRIDYSPDYKSEKPKPLNPRIKITPEGRPYVETKDLVGSALRRIRGTSDPDRESERARLERKVIEAAKDEYKIEREADRGANTITRTDALIKLQPLMQKRREAVAALVEFESSQEKK